MNRRVTLAQLMLVIGAVALEFGTLPMPLAVAAACPTVVFPALTPAWRWGALGLTLVGLGVAAPLMNPRGCEHTPKNQCMNNLRLVALALHGYHYDHGCFPPAYLADAAGKPMHSWRVLILPYMEQKELYAAYNFAEPWDGPNNRTLAGQMPRLYACPGGPPADRGLTSYAAIAGPGTAFPGGTSSSLTDIRDGPSTTLLLVEAADAGIPWLEPRDLDVRTMGPHLNEATAPGISALHAGGGPNVALADGSTRRLTRSPAPEAVRILATIDGGEAIDPGSLDRP